jgi:hypothetical protein
MLKALSPRRSLRRSANDVRTAGRGGLQKREALEKAYLEARRLLPPRGGTRRPGRGKEEKSRTALKQLEVAEKRVEEKPEFHPETAVSIDDIRKAIRCSSCRSATMLPCSR